MSKSNISLRYDSISGLLITLNFLIFILVILIYLVKYSVN